MIITQDAGAALELGEYGGAQRISPAYHPLSDLLTLSAAEILSYYSTCQIRDFTRALANLRNETIAITDQIDLVKRYLSEYPSGRFAKRMQVTEVESLFIEMHQHVMAHPVWVHPFFVRVAAGEITRSQLKVFAQQYFNQVKNTRQCVALALGRFHSFIDTPDRRLNSVLSEMTQIILAGLLADEYGSNVPPDGSDGTETSGEPGSISIRSLFSATTHPALFRRFLDALGVPLVGYDVPMLHGTADNVLVQRILASDPAYDELEALASVGLGMEWGVPAFFSMLIAGILKVDARDGLGLSPAAMEIWSSHVKQDVQHAIAVTIATCFYVRDDEDVTRVKGATNLLMAFRYDMMSDIYEDVFGCRCARVVDVSLDPAHCVSDRRLEPLLLAARRHVHSSAVRDHESYVRHRGRLPLPAQ